MVTLSDFIEPETYIWNCIHAWVTNSTVYELLSRILLFGSDIHTLNEIHSHSESRAMEIANSRSSLSTLIGININIMPDKPINGSLFLHQQQLLVPRWRRIALSFQKMNFGLTELKYQPKKNDPHYRTDPHYHMGGVQPTAHTVSTATTVLKLGAYELERRFMALPVLAILFPIFR